MAFTSVEFALFAVCGVLLYYVMPKKTRWAVLLILSWVFYLAGGVGMGAYLAFTTVTTYLFSRLIGSVKTPAKDASKEEKARAKHRKRLFAACALILNFGLLYVVKYWNFTLDLLKIPGSVMRFDFLLPLGISFYIFQSMGYIIDLVRGKYEPEKNIFKLALFTSFFPQMTQGPIGRFDELSPQLYKGNDFSFDNIKEGLKLSVWGLIKKMVIADRASVIACAVIDNYTSYRGSVILFGVLFYCLQLYCDFSGGIDIARGVARLFGVDMAHNFKRPLFAKSLTEFWRRWHITLGSWLKDYLFYPITLSKPFIKLGKFTRKHIKGKAGKILPTSLATFIVYFVIGIWHGASWKYILFGCYNGVIITASLLLEPWFIQTKNKLKIKDDSRIWSIWCILRTCAIVVLGRYITRAAGVGDALDMIIKTVTDFSPAPVLDGTLFALGLTKFDYLIVALGALAIFVIEYSEEHGVRLSEKIEAKGTIPVFLMIFAVLFVFVVFGVFRGSYISSEFIYKQF